MTENTDRLLSRIADETDIFATFSDDQVMRLVGEFRAGDAAITEDEIVKGIQIIGSWEALGGWYAPQAELVREGSLRVTSDANLQDVRMHITEAGLRKAEYMTHGNN